jgi:hypothetical protein
MPRTFYRIVKNARPSREDFLSNAALGRKPIRTLTADQQDRWSGLSVFDSRLQAQRQARDRPILGTYIAELSIGNDVQARWQRTNPSNPGHHTLWADADDLVACVARVDPVD